MRKACALTLLLLAFRPAMALPPEPAPEIELFIAGSSAQDESLENLMRLAGGTASSPNICQEGTLDIYRGVIQGTDKRVFYCLTSDLIEGVPAGVRLAVHKSSGGSGESVRPVADQVPIPFIDLANLPPGCQPSRMLFSGNLAAYTNHRGCGGAGKVAVPQIGISDIEPALLASADGELTLSSRMQLVWGLPVSKNLRNALQAIQGLVPADVAHDAAIRETEGNMPSLTRAQVASIFAGSLKSWGQLYDKDGVPLYLSAALPAQPPARPNLSGTSPGAYRPDEAHGKPIYVCRRINSSGTQAAYEVHYLQKRCIANAPDFVSPDDGSSAVEGGYPILLVRRSNPAGRVFAGIGTSDVRACLDAHDDHNRWAIGMFSSENIGNNGSNEFRHIKIDGHAPSLVNAHHGLWSHVSEPTIHWRSSDSDGFEATAEGRTLVFIRNHIGQPRVLSSLNAAFEHPWGQGGYLAMPDTAPTGMQRPVTSESLRENPVSGSSNSVSNCNVSIISGHSSAAGN